MRIFEIFKTTLIYASLLCFELTNGSQDVLENINSALAFPLIDFPQMYSFRKAYDFIIIGCGAAGSLLTNRLTEDPSFQVLCIEAGDKENALTDVPHLDFVLPFTPVDWNYKAEPQEGICQGMKDKRCPWPRGKALGGTTAINYMMYNRGNPNDFNKWAEMGNPGWSFKDIVHYFKKFENAQNLQSNDKSHYGMHGEVNIEYPTYTPEIIPSLIESTMLLGVKHRDINGKSQIGVDRVPSMLRNQRRVTAANTFLFPVRDRSNLHVAKNTFVKKILIDPKSKTARGVEVLVFNVTHTIKATKEVILSAGVINSPQLLMLSGIGPRNHLREFNIPVVQDLPAVGKHLLDHVALPDLIFLTEKPTSPIYPFPLSNYGLFAKGLLTTGNVDAFAFINTRNKSHDYSGLPPCAPDIEIIYTGMLRNLISFYARSISLSQDVFNDLYGPILGKNAFVMVPIVLKPKSSGYVELRSPDPFDHPKIFSNYFEDEADQQTLLRGIRAAIKIGLGKPLRHFKPKLYEIRVKQCKDQPFNTDEYWLCLMTVLADSLYHPVGTCKMGPANDPETVVDPKLRVKGINNLRIVDGSIMPDIPSCHLTSVSYVIAEKAADMIKAEYSNG